MKSLDDGSFIILLLLVDDMLIAASHLGNVDTQKAILAKEFNMKDMDVMKKSIGKLWLS